MKDVLTIVGVKKFNGQVEGVTYDNTKVVVLLPVPKKNSDTAIGFNINEVTFGKHENFDLFRGKQFPLKAEVEFELTNKGMEIEGVTFLPATKVG